MAPAPIAFPGEERIEVDPPGRVESFEEYYRRDWKRLVGLAYVLTGSLPVAEDLCHDALTEAHRRWDRIAGYDDPGAWVRKVLVNKSRSRFRRLQAEARAVTRIGQRRELPAEPSEPAQEVWAAVRRLPTRQAQAIVLRYWEDRSVAEIAELLDCGTETVKTHLSRGRRVLAQRLDDHDDRRSG